MKAKEIQDLIEFISNVGMDEVNIETDQIKLLVKRHSVGKFTAAPAQVVQAAPALPSPAPSTAAAPGESTPASGDSSSGKDDESKYIAIKSPMIGTFYRTPNPDSPVFVNVGDKIEKGQTVCIIEAMKLFNEIESDVSGTIVKVSVENSSPVEYDQVLFLVDPS
jgi:acetyl-CoA carboxylase biotin carboxyl carrier protein